MDSRHIIMIVKVFQVKLWHKIIYIRSQIISVKIITSLFIFIFYRIAQPQLCVTVSDITRATGRWRLRIQVFRTSLWFIEKPADVLSRFREFSLRSVPGGRISQPRRATWTQHRAIVSDCSLLHGMTLFFYQTPPHFFIIAGKSLTSNKALKDFKKACWWTKSHL